MNQRASHQQRSSLRGNHYLGTGSFRWHKKSRTRTSNSNSNNKNWRFPAKDRTSNMVSPPFLDAETPESRRRRNDNEGTRSQSQSQAKPDQINQLNQLSCDMCDEEFQNPAQLLTHLRYHVAEEKNPSIRAIANTILKSIAAKLASEQSEGVGKGGVGPEPRSVPPAPVAAAATVKLEIRVEDPEQEQPTELSRAQLINTHEDQRGCQKQRRIGHKSFKGSGSAGLRQHKQVHAREKPYQCVYCKKLFSYKQSMRQHVRQHTGERPYKCQFCEKAYTALAPLKWHLKNQAHGSWTHPGHPAQLNLDSELANQHRSYNFHNECSSTGF